GEERSGDSADRQRHGECGTTRARGLRRRRQARSVRRREDLPWRVSAVALLASVPQPRWALRPRLGERSPLLRIGDGFGSGVFRHRWRGDEDLIVTLEWGAIHIFLNDHG